MPSTFDLIDEADRLLLLSWGYESADFDAALTSFVAAAADKLHALRVVVRLAEGRVLTCKGEAMIWDGAAKAAANRAERCKYLAEHLYRASVELGEPLPGGKLQQNGGKPPLVYAEGFAASSLPAAYQRVTVEADTDAIRAALERGEVVPGVELGDRGAHFRFVEGK